MRKKNYSKKQGKLLGCMLRENDSKGFIKTGFWWPNQEFLRSKLKKGQRIKIIENWISKHQFLKNKQKLKEVKE